MTPAPHKFYVYAVIDIVPTPPELVDVRTTRQEARLKAQQLVREGLRVRRGKLTLFET